MKLYLPEIISNVFTNLLWYFVLASCSIDSRAINTFDNKTYPVELGKCWHVVMQTIPDDDDDSSSSSSSSDDDEDEISVLVRDIDSKKKVTQ